MKQQATDTTQQQSRKGQQPSSAVKKGRSFGILATILVAIVFTLSIGLLGCGGSGGDTASGSNSSATQSDSGSSASTSTGNNESSSDADSGDYSWRQFMTDYEAWVDSYVAFMKKYKENPTDTTLMTEAAQLMTESSQWAEKVEQWDPGTMTPSESAEYMAILNRIHEKLNSVL